MRFQSSQRSHEQLFFTDRLLAATVLRLFPRWVRPNDVTVFRMLATPFVLWLIIVQNYVWGIPVFLLVAFTDAIDGALARTRNQITDWGKLYDPLADKLLIGSVVAVVVLQHLDLWLGIAILGIESTFILGAWYFKWRGMIVQANVWGKIKMILEVLAVFLLLLSLMMQWPSLLPFSQATFMLAIAFALVSLVTYGI
ncbi:CDP-alcohol phosphatidyltransferase family protein [Candidatus Uhrbacteria bacterium]|nr:CDP-alcohol phosphatidyltransferase family protein [Candidatus Uhrbacteria bacterium]